jgi:hypothetical protein
MRVILAIACAMERIIETDRAGSFQPALDARISIPRLRSTAVAIGASKRNAVRLAPGRSGGEHIAPAGLPRLRRDASFTMIDANGAGNGTCRREFIELHPFGAFRSPLVLDRAATAIAPCLIEA